jgi:tight adherence protein C
MTVLLAAVLATACILIVVGAVLPFLVADAVQVRLAQFADRPRSLEELELGVPFGERVLRPLLQRLARLMQRISRQKDPQAREHQTGALQQRLDLAGNPNRWSPTDFLGVKALAAIMVGGFLFLALTIIGLPFFALLAAGGGALVGFVLPDMYLRQLIGSRQHEIQRSMPDALDLLCVSVQAGLGFDAALARLCEKTNNKLSNEFSRMLQEMRVGRQRRDALKEVINRTQVPDLTNFISAIVQADQLGVSITQVLTVQAEQMRTVRRQRAEEQAAQAPLKMLFPMILFIFPALCIVILGPMWPNIVNMSSKVS